MWKFVFALILASSACAQVPIITGVVNAFSPLAAAPLGSLAAVNGSNFGTEKTALTATVQGQAAFVVSAADTQLIIQTPWPLQSGPTPLVVTRGAVSSAPFNVLWGQYAVAIETTDGKSASLLDASSLAQVSQVQPGEVVIAFATGLGPTNPPVALGTLPSGITTCASPPTLSLGPFSATLSACGLATNLVGVYQLKYRIPANVPPGSQPLGIGFSFTRPGIALNQPVSVTVAQPLPAITAVVENAASNIPPGLPNSGIAQGAMFVVKGSNLGPTAVVQAASFPLLSVLGGASVAVTVGGTTVNAVMYYAQASQVAAILPSGTPVGNGTVSVQYNGQSTSAPITVVENAIGIFTVNESGNGDAIAFVNSDGGLIVPTHAANPGDVVVFWGTGLGPVNFDEAKPAVDADMPDVPLQVFIGGQKAEILFRGRNSCCSGIDTVYVKIPEGVDGCAVSVMMQIGTVSSIAISNATTIAVAPSGRTCRRISPDPILGGTGTHTFAGFALNRLINTYPANAPEIGFCHYGISRVAFPPLRYWARRWISTHMALHHDCDLGRNPVDRGQHNPVSRGWSKQRGGRIVRKQRPCENDCR